MASARSATQEALVPSFTRLQIQQDHDASFADAGSGLPRYLRPEAPRRSTEPPPTGPVQASHPIRPRTRSPFSKGHMRSHSAQGLSAPPMARTKSLPTVTLSHWPASTSPARPSSPLRPPPSRVSPRVSFEEVRPLSSSGAGFLEIESIAEDVEVDFTSRNFIATSTMPNNSVSFSRSNSGRRRPTSPLHQQANVSPTSSEPFISSSPQQSSSSRFNEVFPSTFSSGSSMPSTPTSMRSRSPSVSSLDTIEDSPDAEEEATEAYEIASLKASTEAAEASEAEAETMRKLRAAGVEAPVLVRPTAWSPQSLKEKRKRWSVCGAERRADFEMETIWED